MMGYKDIGIDDGYSFLRLHASDRHKVVLAEMRDRTKPHHHGYWVRTLEGAHYSKLCGTPGAPLDHQDPVFDADAPVVYLNVYEQTPTKDIEGRTIHGYDWHGVETFDLATRRSVGLCRTVDDGTPHARTFVSGLIAPTGQPGIVIAKVGVMDQFALGAHHVRYWLCRYDTQTGVCERLTELQATFI